MIACSVPVFIILRARVAVTFVRLRIRILFTEGSRVVRHCIWRNHCRNLHPSAITSRRTGRNNVWFIHSVTEKMKTNGHQGFGKNIFHRCTSFNLASLSVLISNSLSSSLLLRSSPHNKPTHQHLWKYESKIISKNLL